MRKQSQSKMKNKISNYVTLAIVWFCFPYLVIQYLESGVKLTISSYIGIALMIPALFMFTAGRLQLGSSFQTSAEAKNLVTEGIYKKIRHPIYISGLILILGFIFITQQFLILIVWVALIFMQQKRIKNEEKVLLEKFGDRYLEYRKSTWF
jgi:protein-S-isoprenylcysteine O-methyltransferase Ste14